MKLLDLIERIFDSRLFWIGYVLFLVLRILAFINGLYINESYTWSENTVVFQHDYWVWRDPSYLLETAYLLVAYGLYLLRVRCAECFAVGGILAAFCWPSALVWFGVAAAWAAFKDARAQRRFTT